MLKIVTVPSNTLSSPTKPVDKIDDKIKKIVFEMEKILVAQTDPPGVGLAANQVGLDLSLFIIKAAQKAKIKVFINPKIVKISQSSSKLVKTSSTNSTNSTKKKHKRVKLEGCLSIPRIWGPVQRADKILLKYQTVAGDKKTNWFSGFEAMIIQHEMDHLNGILFTQRAVEQKGQLYREEEDKLTKIDNL